MTCIAKLSELVGLSIALDNFMDTLEPVLVVEYLINNVPLQGHTFTDTQLWEQKNKQRFYRR